jgi:hypothetical protein
MPAATTAPSARAYDAAAWRFRHPRHDLKAEFLAPAQRLLIDEDRSHHRQAQRRLVIAERDERVMQQWRGQFPGDVQDEEAFFTAQSA